MLLSPLVAKDDEDDDDNGYNSYSARDPTSNGNVFPFALEGSIRVRGS